MVGGSSQAWGAPVARLEDLTTGTRLTGLAASGTATVESVQWIGEQAREIPH